MYPFRPPCCLINERLPRGTVSPLQSANLTMQAKPWANPSGVQDTYEFVSQRLAEVLLGGTLSPSAPPPIDLLCSHVNEVFPPSLVYLLVHLTTFLEGPSQYQRRCLDHALHSQRPEKSHFTLRCFIFPPHPIPVPFIYIPAVRSCGGRLPCLLENRVARSLRAYICPRRYSRSWACFVERNY